MVSEARKQSMAWMETDYSKHTHFRWKIKWRLEHLCALRIMGETAFKLIPYQISFIHVEMDKIRHANKTNFHMKGFALALALRQRRKTTWKSTITADVPTLALRQMSRVVTFRNIGRKVASDNFTTRPRKALIIEPSVISTNSCDSYIKKERKK